MHIYIYILKRHYKEIENYTTENDGKKKLRFDILSFLFISIP